jgi:hypothetical protein
MVENERSAFSSKRRSRMQVQRCWKAGARYTSDTHSLENGLQQRVSSKRSSPMLGQKLICATGALRCAVPIVFRS